MFSVGRYDPNLQDDSQKERKNFETRKKVDKNCGRKKQKLSDNNSRSVSGGIDDERMDLTQKDECNDESSSSCPVSSDDDSSSSAPSSDSDEDDHPNKNNDEKSVTTPAFQVIAPEQKIQSIDVMRKKLHITSEEIDDFDHDQENQMLLNQPDEIKKALKMSKMSIKEAAKIWNLAPFLVDNLERDNYKSFFPIQALVIPDVIASERYSHIRNRDVCVSSPTGSGKTLSFVIPVLNALAKRRIRRLRALVVLPSRDLATQVYDVFERYAQGSDLKIGLVIGETDFEAEQKTITFGLDKPFSMNYHRMQYAIEPFSIKNALQAFGDNDDDQNIDTDFMTCSWAESNLKRLPGFDIQNGGSSSIDVLVCTPGRLMDHLEKTPGFTLQHLRFLVIDEADRLLNQSYQNWIRRVVDATLVGPERIRKSGYDQVSLSTKFDPVTWRRDEGQMDKQLFHSLNSHIDFSVCRTVQLRKFLFSATLTKDPKKLMSLGLVNPKHFDAHQFSLKDGDVTISNPDNILLGYSLPDGLSECMVECTAEQKPLVLLAVLLEQELIDKRMGKSDGIVVVFTSSKDSTHRLTRLLQLLWVAAGYGLSSCIGEFSSALNQKQRANLMKRCNNKDDEEGSQVKVIVCSDGMSRGMDIQSVSAVINYDVPSFAKTYVHRCGRTARAGRKGRAISILKGGQVTKFLNMRKLIGSPDKVSKIGIHKDLVKAAIPVYQKCIKSLQIVMDAETNDNLAIDATLGPDLLI